MRKSVLAIALGSTCLGQTIKMTASHQGAEALRTISYKLPAGVAMYNATMCADSVAQVHGARLLQELEQRWSVISPALVDQILIVSRKKSRKVLLLKVVEIAASATAVVVSGYGSKLPDIARYVPTATTFVMNIASGELQKVDVPPTSSLSFIRSDQLIVISSGGCASGFFLTKWRSSENLDRPWSATIQLGKEVQK